MNDDILLAILLSIQDDLATNNKTKKSIISNINEYVVWLQTSTDLFGKEYEKYKLILSSILYNLVHDDITQAKNDLDSYIKSLMQ